VGAGQQQQPAASRLCLGAAPAASSQQPLPPPPSPSPTLSHPPTASAGPQEVRHQQDLPGEVARCQAAAQGQAGGADQADDRRRRQPQRAVRHPRARAAAAWLAAAWLAAGQRAAVAAGLLALRGCWRCWAAGSRAAGSSASAGSSCSCPGLALPARPPAPKRLTQHRPRPRAQIKRIHEYKRQYMNVLSIIWRYKQLKKMTPEERRKQVPRVCVIGGKAASAYDMAKRIIHLVNAVGARRRRLAAPPGLAGLAGCAVAAPGAARNPTQPPCLPPAPARPPPQAPRSTTTRRPRTCCASTSCPTTTSRWPRPSSPPRSCRSTSPPPAPRPRAPPT
jgi:hypothetical protein